MSRPEQPQPYPGDVIAQLPGRVGYRREYRDALGRPLTGQVTVTGTTRTASTGLVIPPAPVVVELVDGVLAAELPPDTYSLSADLRTQDGHRVTDADTVTLTR